MITEGCRVISDPEGLDILQMCNKDTSEVYSGNVIVCGDILDSTLSQDLQKVLNDATTQEKIIEILKLKSCNLKNIYTCITNKKVKLIFGNRDLNKIKCRWLTELDVSGKSSLIDSFNNGQIDLNVNTYKKLKSVFKVRREIPSSNGEMLSTEEQKILGWKILKKLKGYKPKPKQEIRQRWDRIKKEGVKVTYNFLVCICTKYCKLDYISSTRKYRFYEDIKYLYCWDPIYYGMITVLNDKGEEFRIGVDEFNRSFDDYRDHIINNILN
jgi:hypothetical protein